MFFLIIDKNKAHKYIFFYYYGLTDLFKVNCSLFVRRLHVRHAMCHLATHDSKFKSSGRSAHCMTNKFTQYLCNANCFVCKLYTEMEKLFPKTISAHFQQQKLAAEIHSNRFTISIQIRPDDNAPFGPLIVLFSRVLRC